MILRPITSGTATKRLFFLATLLFASLAFADQQPTASTDYAQQRNELLHRANFDPLQMEHDEKFAIDSSTRLWNEGKTFDALRTLHELLDKYPASLIGNRSVAEVLEAFAEHASTQEHKVVFVASAKNYRNIYGNLAQSILESGDGKSEETAYPALNINEEIELLRYQHLTFEEQSLIHEQATGRTYDRYSVKDAADKKSVVFFDITRYWAAEDRSFRERAKKLTSSPRSDEESVDPTGH